MCVHTYSHSAHVEAEDCLWELLFSDDGGSRDQIHVFMIGSKRFCPLNCLAGPNMPLTLKKKCIILGIGGDLTM